MKCHACSTGTMHRGIKPQIFNYRGASITLEQPGSWCDNCGEGILTGEDIAVTEHAFEEFSAKIDRLVKPAEIRCIRKDVLKLKQQEASRVFGGGKNAFSRYERGEIRPSLAVSNLLRMFRRHPEEINDFL